MDAKKFKDLYDAIEDERSNVLVDRNSTYADDTVDYLSSFKETSEILKNFGIDLKPSQVGWVLTAMKFQRLGNMIRKGMAPDHPKVRDQIIDFHNFIDLSYGCMYDEQTVGQDVTPLDSRSAIEKFVATTVAEKK